MNVYVVTELSNPPVVKVFSTHQKADAYVAWRCAPAQPAPELLFTVQRIDEEPGEVKITVWLVGHNGDYLRSRVAVMSQEAWHEADTEQLDALCAMYLRHEDPAEVAGAHVFYGTDPVRYFSQSPFDRADS